MPAPIRLGGRRFLLAGAIMVAAIFLGLGVSLPFLQLTRAAAALGSDAQAYSLLSAIGALFRANQPVLGSVLLVLALFLPVLRLLYLVLLAALPPSEIGRSGGQLRAIEWLGRWSPHDLLALALAATLIATQQPLLQRVAAGAYCFAASMLAVTLAYAWLRADIGVGPRVPPGPRGMVFPALAALASVAFVAGITLPAVRLSNAYAGADQHSIASLIWALQARGEVLLWASLLTLAVLLPGFRLLFVVALALAGRMPPAIRAGTLRIIGPLGRYAIADTLVLSLMLLHLVASGAADAQLQPGAIAVAASAGLTLLCHAWASFPPAAKGSSVQPSSLAARLAGLGSKDAAAGT